MSTAFPPETRQNGARSRPWSIGSQLLGHYDQGRNHQNTNAFPEDGMSHSPAAAIGVTPNSNTHWRASLRESIASNGAPRSYSPAPVQPSAHGRGQDPPPLIRASTTFYDRIVTDWWWWELFSCLVSILCFAAIVGMLRFYDGKQQPQFVVPGITLNAYIAVFAAIAKATLILPVSEAIGQLKWLWFGKEAQLWEFFTFDSASRGPWGALMLLGRTKCRCLASIGAAITILALAFEPFLQQIVSYPTREVFGGNSTVSIATSFHPEYDFSYDSRQQFAWNFPGKSISTAVNEAIFSKDSFMKPPPSVCPTGKCSWPSYFSLGVCHQCEDESSLLSYVCGEAFMNWTSTGTQASTPCGFQMNDTFFVGTNGYKQKQSVGLATAVKGEKIVSGVEWYWNSTLFINATNPIIDFYIAFTPGNETEIRAYTKPKLLECLFHWCVKTFKSTYEDGQLSESLVYSYAEQSTNPGHQSRNLTRCEPFPLDLNIPFVFNLGGNSFEVGENTTGIVKEAIAEVLPRVLVDTDRDNDGQYPAIWSIVQYPSHDINTVFDKLATALTNNMRSQSNGTEKIIGDAWTRQTFVEARWLWIILPSMLMVGAFGFVSATIVMSRLQNASTWKSSALATLLHGITKDTREQFGAASSMSEIEAIARKVQVKVKGRDKGGRLVPV